MTGTVIARKPPWCCWTTRRMDATVAHCLFLRFEVIWQDTTDLWVRTLNLSRCIRSYKYIFQWFKLKILKCWSFKHFLVLPLNWHTGGDWCWADGDLPWHIFRPSESLNSLILHLASIRVERWQRLSVVILKFKYIGEKRRCRGSVSCCWTVFQVFFSDNICIHEWM